MDFMNRGFRNTNQATNHAEQPAHQPGGTEHAKHGGGKKPISGLKQAGSLTFLIALVLIVAGMMFVMINFRNNNEGKFIDTSKYQAVFLNGGQVYFGKVNNLNKDYVRLNDIFYLRVNQQVQPNGQNNNNNDVSLVKLGCELHGPYDQMVISQDQVIFWENIKDDGQVVKAINEYKKQYPNGEDCTKQNSNATNSTPATNSTTTNTNSNGSGN